MKQIAYGVFAWAFLQVRRKMESGFEKGTLSFKSTLFNRKV